MAEFAAMAPVLPTVWAVDAQEIKSVMLIPGCVVSLTNVRRMVIVRTVEFVSMVVVTSRVLWTPTVPVLDSAMMRRDDASKAIIVLMQPIVMRAERA